MPTFADDGRLEESPRQFYAVLVVGPPYGYRVYFVRRGEALVILVAGGDKRTQSHDIAMAIKLARDL